jgi:hypothetical protein
LIELHSDPISQGRIAGYRIGEDQSGSIGRILQPGSGSATSGHAPFRPIAWLM